METSGRASWRKTFFWISATLFVTGLISTILMNWPKQGKHVSFSTGKVIAYLVNTTPGDAKKRQLLHQVMIDRVKPADALRNMKLRQSEAFRLWFRTRREFLERFQVIIRELELHYDQLLMR